MRNNTRLSFKLGLVCCIPLEKIKYQMPVNPLAGVPLFSDFPLDELDRLLTVLDVVNLKSGEILFHEGDPSERMYVVVSGVLEILRRPVRMASQSSTHYMKVIILVR